MTSATNVFTSFFRTVAAAVLVIGSFLFSLRPADRQPHPTQVGAELERRSYPAPESSAYIARHSQPAHSFPEHSRTKEHAKVFFVDLAAGFVPGIARDVIYKGLHFLPRLPKAIKPAYYQFLFRYTPF